MDNERNDTTENEETERERDDAFDVEAAYELIAPVLGMDYMNGLPYLGYMLLKTERNALDMPNDRDESDGE